MEHIQSVLLIAEIHIHGSLSLLHCFTVSNHNMQILLSRSDIKESMPAGVYELFQNNTLNHNIASVQNQGKQPITVQNLPLWEAIQVNTTNLF